MSPPDSPTVRRSALERRITRAAVERGTTQTRLRRLIGFTVLCEVLAEAQYRGILPLFFIKGGVAIELRLGLASRATRDIDIGLCAPPETLLPVLDEALAIGFDDFRLRRPRAARVLENGIHRLEIALDYLDRPWATIAVDLGPATGDSETDVVPPLDLRDVELATGHAIPCLAIHEQIAQKMHALTEPEPHGQPNPRARDVLDILLLIDRLAIELDAVRAACGRVFVERATHPWPIYVFTFPPAWPAILAELAREIGYNTDDALIIQSRFNDLLARLNGAPALPNFEYQFAILDFIGTNDPQGDTFAAPIKQDDGNARWQHLDALTKGGWRVHSMQEYRRQSAGRAELLVLLERERQQSA